MLIYLVIADNNRKKRNQKYIKKRFGMKLQERFCMALLALYILRLLSE